MGVNREEARRVYDSYIERGLMMKPPFKGFGIALICFAMDEPDYFKVLYENEGKKVSFHEFIDEYCYKDKCLKAIEDTFNLSEAQAETLFYNIMISGIGMAYSIVYGSCSITIEEASAMMGRTCRAFLMELHSGEDIREGYVPSESVGPEGKVDTYVDEGFRNISRKTRKMLISTLISQSVLLKELHSSPRFVKDREWEEIQKMLGIDPKIQSLSTAELRLVALSCFGFSTGESAVLLGISPASVTKARQRLKNKLGVQSIEDFAASL